MTSKTPKFDQALDEYFSKLELDEKGGQWRVCRFSGEKFYVRLEDVEFYKKMRVPLPTLSPDERERLILAFWNSYHLFNSKSALTGNQIISQYPPNTQYKIYEHQLWYGGNWNPEDYEREYNSGESFFEQFIKLHLNVPRPSLFINNTSVNSDYCNDSVNLKNCYLVFNAWDSENCHYSISPVRSRDCVDCFDIFDSSLCAECFESHELYNCRFVEFSKNCLDSTFLYDCRNCTYCFGGVNLRNKKYIFFGEQLTKEGYDKKIVGIDLGDRDILAQYKSKFQTLIKTAIHKPNHNEKSVNSSGDYVRNSKDCFHCHWIDQSERCAYSIGAERTRDSYDVNTLDSELSYMSSGSVGCYKIMFSNMMEGCRDSEYSDYCGNCHDVFGSIGLLNKSYCIFNKQYAEEEYWRVLDEIKKDMLLSGEYGEFFPPYISPFPYKISLAASYSGYDDLESAKKYGYVFEDIPQEAAGSLEDTVDSLEVPKNIKNIKDDILEKVIFDACNKKKFRFTKNELEFRRKFGLALPIEHFTARLKEKRDKFGSVVLRFYERVCPKCRIKFEAVYRPDDPRIVYCEPCYLKEIV
ncbi:hypothetical protein A3H65_03970 [Candidatus Giovannonibacteria bacterium RIFCSPLOWO2_02_FULL_45_14]|nr:MAG: hypothetical protein A3H65_03970 [Candidatus Giovannonibacteria bacterium RIFCSPLOWO2_02_FULL_45_14]